MWRPAYDTEGRKGSWRPRTFGSPMTLPSPTRLRRGLACAALALAALSPAASAAPADSLDAFAGLPLLDLRAKYVDAHPATADAHLARNAYERSAAEVEAARLAAEAVRRAAMGARYFPEDAADVMAAEAAVARRHFGGARRRARSYFPMIERALARHGLPDDLKYVAVVESALDPLAVSHAGAEGMWQFMPATQADYGLDSLSVRDPAQATTAAARYLRSLGRMFDGDWQLALAAYNSGPGRVQRIARAYEAETGREATFWDIRDRLPRETQAYVPRWIAVADWMGG